MNIESIEKFLNTNGKKFKAFNIHFKKRTPVTGVFINTKDSEELKAKNYWRIVNLKNFSQWKATRDITLSRLFDGSNFTHLTGSVK